MYFKELLGLGQNKRKILKLGEEEIWWDRRYEIWKVFPTNKAFRFTVKKLRSSLWEISGEWSR